MPSNKILLGQHGEQLVAEFLQRHGLKILARNLKNRLGEIDILAKDGNDLVIIEVKTKTDRRHGHPGEMVNFYKQRKLINLAYALLQQFPSCSIRIDVVAVDMLTYPPTIEHIKNAVLGR